MYLFTRSYTLAAGPVCAMFNAGKAVSLSSESGAGATVAAGGTVVAGVPVDTFAGVPVMALLIIPPDEGGTAAIVVCDVPSAVELDAPDGVGLGKGIGGGALDSPLMLGAPVIGAGYGVLLL